MTEAIAEQASSLIERILSDYHERHRQDLPELIALARAVEARGLLPGVSDDIRAIGEELERHMFKEEMRLFPMMEQGGNSLIQQLIDEMQAEHRSHGAAMAELRQDLAALSSAADADPALVALAGAVERLAGELAEHIRTEDEDLFALFNRPVRRI